MAGLVPAMPVFDAAVDLGAGDKPGHDKLGEGVLPNDTTPIPNGAIPRLFHTSHVIPPVNVFIRGNVPFCACFANAQQFHPAQ